MIGSNEPHSPTAKTNTPPAVPEGTLDVREALAEVLYEADIDNNPESQLPESWKETCAEEPGWAEGFRHAADRVRLAFEVRPHGTAPAEQISDVFADYVDHLGVDANEDHDGEWWDGYRQAQRDNMRHAAAALEAARKARP